MATRGPGAAGLTPAHSLAASNPCLNCGTNVQLTYCPECGQREIDSDPTLREFLHELAEEFLHWDGKLLTTFRLLVARPGALTCEYLAGRRVRYISPLRVYLAFVPMTDGLGDALVVIGLYDNHRVDLRVMRQGTSPLYVIFALAERPAQRESS